jgi:hypothetical protein
MKYFKHLSCNPPCHRMSGFCILVVSILFNLPALYPVHNFSSFTLYILSLVYFSLFSYYAFLFLHVNHYTDPESKHISLNYVKMIQSETNNWIRFILIISYYLIFLGSYAFSTYLPESYSEITPYQKTIFAYNYTMTSFTVMYLYEHKNMNKYLSLNNITIYDNENHPVNYNTMCTEETPLEHISKA